MAFTKIVGAGIHTLSNVHTHNINSSGIITATQFVGIFTGGGGNLNSGIVTCTGLDVNGNGDISGNFVVGGNFTVNGTTTTLDTNLTEVDKLEVSANNSTVGAAITQSGSGDILNLYDGSTEVFSVADGGVLSITGTGSITNNPSTDVGLRVTNNATQAFSTSENMEGTTNRKITPLMLRNGSTSANTETYLGFDAGNTSKAQWNIGIKKTGALQGDFIFNTRTGSSTSAERLRITNDGKIAVAAGGNVGFATDSNTYIEQDGLDRISFVVGGLRTVSMVEASNMPVLIIDKNGTNTSKDLQGGGYYANPNSNDLVIGNVSSGNHGITICSASSAIGNINFSDGNQNAGHDAYRGSVGYHHNTEQMIVRAKSGTVILQNDATNTLVASGGKIGIGTDNPVFKLDVDYSGGEDGIRILNRGTASGSTSMLRFGNDENINAAFLMLNSSGYSSVGGAYNLVLGHGLSRDIVFSTGGTEKIRITSGGDLSLRQTTQNEYRGLLANSTAINLTLGSTAGANPRLYLFGTGNGQSTAGDVLIAAGNGGIFECRSAEHMIFKVDTDNSVSEGLRITSAGLIRMGNGAEGNTEAHVTAAIFQNTTGAATILKLGNTNTPSSANNRAIEFCDGAGGTEGSSKYTYARIKAERTGGSNSGRLIFSTKPNNNDGPQKAIEILPDGDVLIGNGDVTTQAGDGKLIVYASERLHPAIKADCIDGGGNRANGFTLLADNYQGDESICNFGISYSGAGLVLSRGVKVSNTTDDVYLSSMDSYAVKPSAFKLDDDGSFRFLNTNTSATTTTDSAVSLTEKVRITSTGGTIISNAGTFPTSTTETLHIQGEGHNGHGTTNTRSVFNITAAKNSNSNSMGLWIGARTNENTAVIGTRTASGNLAVETYNSGWAERFRIRSDGKVVLSNSSGAMLDLRTAAGTGSCWMQLSDSSGTQKGYFGYGSGSSEILYITQQEDENIQFYTGGTTKMSLTPQGQLAIRAGGTNNTSVNLLVYGDADNTDIATFSGGDYSRGLKISTSQNVHNDANVILDAQDQYGQFIFKTGGAIVGRLEHDQSGFITENGASGDGDTECAAALQNDYSSWGVIYKNDWIGNGSGWGTFWAGNSGARYRRVSSDGNPNEHVMVGSGQKRFTFDLDNGNMYYDGSIAGAPYDYAEYFEWEDGNPSNEDRRGYSVFVNSNGKIEKATDSTNTSDIIGVISGTAAILGDAAVYDWQGKWKVDEWGTVMRETVKQVSWKDGEGKRHSYDLDKVPSGITIPSHASYRQHTRRILNPDYDETKEYVPRDMRQEWDPVGLLGKVRVRDDSPKNPNWKFIKVVNGKKMWLIR